MALIDLQTFLGYQQDLSIGTLYFQQLSQLQLEECMMWAKAAGLS